jgi:DNA-binding MarR family transcriptional regulator
VNIELTADQKDFARQAIEAGRARRARLLAKLDAAEASLVEDGGIEITQQSMRDLADDVKARGRAELAARGK